jgi:hypothetical protein
MELRDSADFEDRIYAKSDVGEIPRRELRRTRPTDGIAIGTATDPYQQPNAVSSAPAPSSKPLRNIRKSAYGFVVSAPCQCRCKNTHNAG